MDINEQLKGKTVMVHPELYHDIAERNGHAGTIQSANVANDDFYVSFPDGKRGRYAADTLLVLKRPEEIHRILDNDKGTLTLSERKDLFNVALLQTHGFPEQTRTALELAIKSPVVRELGLEGFNEGLGISDSRQRGR